MLQSLYNAADRFSRLVNIEYDLVIARKGEAKHIKLHFKDEHFYHLCGLQHFSGNSYFRTTAKQKVYTDILTRCINNDIFNDCLIYTSAKERICCVSYLEEYLDSNNLIFRWDQRQKAFSKIRAEILINNVEHILPCYLFLDKESDCYFCKSIFPSTNDPLGEYTKGLSKFTLLYKRKNYIDTGVQLVQYDKQMLTDDQRQRFSL